MTTSLIQALKKRVPGIKQYLYADDTMIWIPGDRSRVQQVGEQLMAAMREYAEFSGQELNVDKCEVVLQGNWTNKDFTVGGIKVGTKIKYLGVYIGKATAEQQYAGPKRRFDQKMYFLQNTSLTQEEKAEAIRTWGLPVFAVVAKLVYPTEEVLRGLEASIRRAMGVRPMGMTTAIL